MKIYEFPFESYQTDWFFSAIRNKGQVISLWMRAIKIMLLNTPVPDNVCAGKIILNISKMSRLSFVGEKKIYSIAFPFYISATDDGLRFRTAEHPNIDNRVSSDILSLVHSSLPYSDEVFRFAEPIMDLCEADSNLWALFRALLIAEDGYIRYDYDEARQNGHRHPLHHLDVFYSSNSTFKLGLQYNLEHLGLVDILDTEKDCHYISPV